MKAFIFTIKAMTLLVAVMTVAGCASRSGKGSGSGGMSGADMYDSKTGGIGLGTLKRVHFEFDQSTITSDAADTMKSNAKVMKDNGKMRVLVEGHTDERGTNEYNIALGERRGRAALDYLVNLGVARNRLEMKSWGEERPLDFAKNDSAYAENRRAEFVILKK